METKKSEEKKTITKAKLMKATGLGRGTIQFYMQCGFLSASKGANNYNYFTHEDLLNLAGILMYRNMGCSIKEMAESRSFNKAQLFEFYRDKIGDIDRQVVELREKQKILEQKLSLGQYSDKLERLKVYREDPGYCMMVEQNIDNDNYIRGLVNQKLKPVSFKPFDKNGKENPVTVGIFAEKNIYDSRVVWEKRPDTVFFACVFDLSASNFEIEKVRKMPINKELEKKIAEEINKLGYTPINLFYISVFVYNENNNIVAVTKLYIECIQKAKT